MPPTTATSAARPRGTVRRPGGGSSARARRPSVLLAPRRWSPARTAAPRTARTRSSARAAATTSRPARCRAPSTRPPDPARAGPAAVDGRRPGAGADAGRSGLPDVPAPHGGAALGRRGVGRPRLVRGVPEPRPVPSAGPPRTVVLTGRSALVGRPSASRNIHPDVDCADDTGVSRRHAQLTTDGSRFYVEDLESANGTFVAPSGGPLPKDPVAVGPKHELGADDRVYVGAWTRLVVRPATEDETGDQPTAPRPRSAGARTRTWSCARVAAWGVRCGGPPAPGPDAGGAPWRSRSASSTSTARSSSTPTRARPSVEKSFADAV